MKPEPGPEHAYLEGHAALLIRSYRHWTGRDLIDPALSPAEAARVLYHAPFAVLSHNSDPDPRFTYANLAAQRLFEMPWPEIIGLPSRHSAEPLAQAERERLLARVSDQGYIDDYSGVRIARSGRRFRIRNATVWNLIGDDGQPRGQAACFSDWQPLSDTAR